MREIIREHKGFWKQIFMLSKIELSKAYKGTLMGSAWAVIKPLITLMVFWFTFEIGIRGGSEIRNVPRFVFMLTGFVPWFFMNDMIVGGAKCIRNNQQFVTKISYPVSTIMTFSALARAYVHIALTAIMYIYLVAAGYAPTLYNIQILWYFPMMFLFFLALSWITAPLSVYSKDFQNTIDSTIQAMFWLSGILWDTYGIEYAWLRHIMLINPINYFANGYRKAFIYNEWFFDSPKETIVFLIELAFIIIIGAWNYKRLRKTMADVL